MPGVALKSRRFARCPGLEQSIEVLAADPGRAQDVAECAPLDRLVAVDRDGDRVGDIRVTHDVMAAPYALHVPALTFEDLDELLA